MAWGRRFGNSLSYTALRVIALAGLTLALASCDSFSLLDTLVLPGQGKPGPLRLSAAATTVARNGDPVALTVSGGQPPYSFSLSSLHLFTKTLSESIGSVDDQIYSPGGAIGRIEIKVIDLIGNEAKITVFVVPRTPTLSLFPWDPKNGVNISWGYGADREVIDGFEIWRGKDGGTITFWKDFEPDGLSTSDNYMNATDSIYTYRIYAIAGEYRSIPEEDSI